VADTFDVPDDRRGEVLTTAQRLREADGADYAHEHHLQAAPRNSGSRRRNTSCPTPKPAPACNVGTGTPTKTGYTSLPNDSDMKNVDDLIESAAELASRGLSKGEIADELNVSRETASWLVERSDTSGTETGKTSRPLEEVHGGPEDIHVDWSTLGRDSTRLGHVGAAMADLLSKEGEDVDLTVGIEKAGVPIATTVSTKLDTDLASYIPRKHQWNEGDIEDLGATFSKNFAQVRERDCYLVDDTITSGTTMEEAIDAIRQQGGEPVGCVVIVDKQGVEEIDGVPVYSLLQVIRVGNQDGE